MWLQQSLNLSVRRAKIHQFLLSLGFIDLVIEAQLQPYDIVALIPIVEGAGGIITTWDGGPAQGGGRIVAAGDPRIHAAALSVLQGQD